MNKRHLSSNNRIKCAALCAAVALLAACWAAGRALTYGGGPRASAAQAAAQTAQRDAAGTPSLNPFAPTTNPTPPSTVYSGPLFKLSYNYPTAAPTPPVNPPWRKALGGQPIGSGNAIAYTNALKNYIAPSIRQLIFDYSKWDAGAAGWYNQPWLADIREPVHGMYIGSTFPGGTLPAQSSTMTTYVLTYYDRNAAYTVGNVWGTTAMTPNVTNTSAQFKEGAIIIKLAFTTATGAQWPAMQGAATWPIYASTDPNAPIGQNPTLYNVALMQLDIIVKDTKTSPKTGWVFTTLVFDNSVKAGDVWDKMVPLGAMWGNDPEVAANPNAPLKETVINPNAPDYSTATLGWGGRLSGPNDGAVQAPGYVNGVIATVAASSCMSCHGPAEYPMKSFLLPVPAQNFDLENRKRSGVPVINGALVLFEPGSPGWMRWFQSRPGSVPQDPGTVPLDYDMVFSFKSLPAWAKATGKEEKLQLRVFQQADAFRRGLKYNGLP